MKLSFYIALAVAAASALPAAQTPQQGEKVTVAGCLQRAQRNGSVGGTILGTSASPNTADDEANSSAIVDAFLLAEATPMVGGVPDQPSATTAGAASRADTATGTAGRSELTTYGLQGREDELGRHQGARLQVTGTLMPPATSGRGTGGSATASGAKRLRVESFKILAEKCQAQ
jgi:hypothetical protein